MFIPSILHLAVLKKEEGDLKTRKLTNHQARIELVKSYWASSTVFSAKGAFLQVCIDDRKLNVVMDEMAHTI